MGHPYIVLLLTAFVCSAVTGLIAYARGYERGHNEGTRKGFSYGFSEGRGRGHRHDA